MARPAKIGLEYFPLDTDFLTDLKVRRILKTCGPESISVLIYLLCNIYKDNGYYLEWNEDILFIISDLLNIEENKIDIILQKSLEVGFFDLKMYEKHLVLTSKGIQKRYFLATEKRKNNNLIDKFLIINSEETLVNITETLVNVTETSINSTETLVNVTESTQRKEKESKVNKNKYKNIKKSETNTTTSSNALEPVRREGSFALKNLVIDKYGDTNSDLLETFKDFSLMRKSIKKPLTERALKLIFNKLDTLCSNDTNMVIAVLEQSIEHSWQTVYELKGGSNGLHTKVTGNTESKKNWGNLYDNDREL